MTLNSYVINTYSSDILHLLDNGKKRSAVEQYISYL